MSCTFMIRIEDPQGGGYKTLVDIEVLSDFEQYVKTVYSYVDLGLYTRVLLLKAKDQGGFIEHMRFWHDIRGWWFEGFLTSCFRSKFKPQIQDVRVEIQKYFKDFSENNPDLELILVEDK